MIGSRCSLIAFMLVALTLPASAATISYTDAIDILIASCGPDVQTYCGDVRLGSGRVEACLAKNSSRISPQCKTDLPKVVSLLDARAAAQAAVPEVCKADAARLCEDFRLGRARVLRCLIREDNTRKVSNRCNAAIDDAGWR
jgi:hypothetical protein